MSLAARIGVVAALVATAVAAGAGACVRHERWPGPAPYSIQAAASLEVQPSEPPVAVLDVDRPLGSHPRILLMTDRIAVVRGLRDAGAPTWRALAEACDDATKDNIASGYEAWDWVDATLDLALCHAVTRRPDYARAALRYFTALLDDHTKVGDGAGGDAVVHHDDGYSIRTHGCFGAIAYDWLHDAPGMTPELRRHAVDRFVAWTRWFSENGYNRDQPIANYYAGYFGAVAFAGIAAAGDDPRADALRTQARRMVASEILPAYRRQLVGGDFPEGWQYGDLVGTILAAFADAQARLAPARSPYEDLPWLRDIVAYRTHALWPDGKHTFDTGDWSDKPAVAPPHALATLALVLPASDPVEPRARALAKLARDPGEEWRWLDALSDDPTRFAQDPRAGATSYLARGTETFTARTDWSPRAVWFALTSAPSLSDHQHLDAGHFEIVRGGDALVVDAGGYGSFSSLSHNVIAVDDGKENDDYAPNQGTWSHDAKIARFEDDGTHVVALADYASAYDPSGYPADHPRRSVLRAERETVFSRSPVAALGSESARVVVYDRLTLGKPTYGATFLLHGGSDPEIGEGGVVRFAAGKSAAWVTTLAPSGVAPVVVHEPTELGDGPYYANEPPEGTTSQRIEVRSPKGDVERRFLLAIVVGGIADRSKKDVPPATRLDGEGVDGAVIDDEAYVFQRGAPQGASAPLAWRAPPSVSRAIVASLAPGARYDVRAERDRDDCRVSLRPGGARAASPAGVLVVSLGPGCQLR